MSIVYFLRHPSEAEDEVDESGETDPDSKFVTVKPKFIGKRD